MQEGFQPIGYYRIGGINIAISWEQMIDLGEYLGEFYEWQCFPILQAYEIHDSEGMTKEKCDVLVNLSSDKLEPFSENMIQIANQFYDYDNKTQIYEMRDVKTCTHVNIRTEIIEDDKITINLIRNEDVLPVLRLRLLGAALQQIIYHFNGFIMHGSGIEVRGNGVIFTGFSGQGKTTQARLWRKYRNTTVINGDSPLIRETADGVRMYGTPWCGTSGESINRSVPMKAIVIVERSASNRVEEITGDDAVLAVYTSLFYFSRNKEDFDLMMPVFERLVRQIKVFRLYCNMEEDAVNTLDAALLQNNI